MSETAPLNVKNYLNGVFYVINTIVTFGIGVFGWFGAQSNTELSAKYITLVTPKGTAFSIWSVIFLFQAIFVVLQFLPKFRATAQVQEGVWYWYVITCVMQVAWTLSFGFEQITLSLAFMVLLWLSLVAIVFFQYYVAKKQQPNNTLLEFWLLRFPFAIHCGWITCASVVNVNVVAVRYAPEDAVLQLAMGIVSLAYLHAVSVWVCLALDRPNFTIAIVIAWAIGFVSDQLNTPFDLIKERFSETIIGSVGWASLAVVFIIGIQVAVRLVLMTGVTDICFNPKEAEEVKALTIETKTKVAAPGANDENKNNKDESSEESVEVPV